MEVAAIWNEPNLIEALENCPKVYQKFKEARCLSYLSDLRDQRSQLPRNSLKNLNRNEKKVMGLKLEVIEEVIAWLASL